MSAQVVHRGGCHCGAVRFEVEAPAALEVYECNCSMCAKVGFLHLIASEARFRITAGAEMLTVYTFNTGVAKHMFCRTCGVKPFYRPRSNPDGWSVNARCLDEGTVASLTVKPFDGRNWESAGAGLAHLSAS